MAIVTALSSCGGNSRKAPTGSYKVGDTATTSGWQVTVYGAKDPWTSTDGSETATPGDRYVQVDVQVLNTKPSQETFSSLLAFKLLDSKNRVFTETAVSSQPGPPNGTVPPGGALRGNVTFEVRNSSTGLVFQAQGSLTAAGARFAVP